MRKNIKDFVCPFCFQQINKCKCDHDIYTLIMIDEKMQYAIQKLNSLHYKTSACCEGHYSRNNTIKAYIYFKNKPDSSPVGWLYRRNGLYYESPVVQNKTKFKLLQKEAIEQLNKWVDTLQPYNWS